MPGIGGHELPTFCNRPASSVLHGLWLEIRLNCFYLRCKLSYLWSTGATHKLTSVYDDRNVRSRSETPRRGKRGGDTPDAPLPRPEDKAIRDGDQHGTVYWDGAMYFGASFLKWRASDG